MAHAKAPPLPGWALVCLGGVMSGVWAAAVWVAAHLEADPALHTAALFAHLASLVVGLGAVMVVDLVGLLWLLGRRSILDVARVVDLGHLAIWVGLAGLVLSGVLLHPDLSSPLVWLKLFLVLAVGLNGLHAHAIRQLLHRLAAPTPPRGLVARVLVAGLLSQAGWWGATLVGFLNAQS
ncbi:MAG: hypothetical protein ACRDYU_13135 [Actinomycetes bacterium]